MRTANHILLAAGLFATVSVVVAQPPGRPDGGPRGDGPPPDAAAVIDRMMTFDANQDGQLTKAEITDARLMGLFDRADENHDGIVTREELTTLHGKESPAGRGGPGRGGPGGPGMGGPPIIGEVMPRPVREMLKLSNGQQKKLDALQKLVDSRLEQILNDEQKQQLHQMRDRGPGGRGGPGGPGGFGGPPDGPGGRREGGGGDGENVRPRRPPE
ncbi:EF-hand domain-containing protein [Schlesneria paludicola]|uniref:hypothetical protein n=1 Tax=Schlesneria paludicola TaxID=360056 RepID=UPI000299D7C9|nr:hypothetical protein [Schlesneria paludicola]